MPNTTPTGVKTKSMDPSLRPNRTGPINATDAEIVKLEETPQEEVKVDAGLRPEGWEGVVWDCERVLGCPDHCESPETSNLANIINDLRTKEKNLAIDIINIVREHL